MFLTSHEPFTPGESIMIAKTRKLTYQDYLGFPDDGTRHEILDGDHSMKPVPSTYHQDVSRLIQFQLMSQIEMTGHGRVFNAPGRSGTFTGRSFTGRYRATGLGGCDE